MQLHFSHLHAATSFRKRSAVACPFPDQMQDRRRSTVVHLSDSLIKGTVQWLRAGWVTARCGIDLQCHTSASHALSHHTCCVLQHSMLCCTSGVAALLHARAPTRCLPSLHQFVVAAMMHSTVCTRIAYLSDAAQMLTCRSRFVRRECVDSDIWPGCNWSPHLCRASRQMARPMPWHVQDSKTMEPSLG